MTTIKKNSVLSQDIYATFIHGVTGQEVEEGTVCAGALVKNIREHEEGYEGTIYRFEVSTDGGKLWYTHQSYSRPVTE